MACCVSQFGDLNEAYANIDQEYPIEDIIFPQSQCGMGMPIGLHAMTAQQQFYLNFNFTTPAMDEGIVASVAERIVEYLTHPA